MSTTDLSILADAVTFAILVAVGGAVAYAIARATWKRRSMHKSVKMGLSGVALVAVGLAGVAVWPSARDGVTSAAAIGGFDVDSAGTISNDPLARTNPGYISSPPKGRPARVFEAAPYTPGGIDLTPPTYTSTSSSTDTDPTDGTTSPTDSTTTPPVETTTPPVETTTPVETTQESPPSDQTTGLAV